MYSGRGPIRRGKRVYTQGGDRSGESRGYILRAGTNPVRQEGIFSGRGPIRRVRRQPDSAGSRPLPGARRRGGGALRLRWPPCPPQGVSPSSMQASSERRSAAKPSCVLERYDRCTSSAERARSESEKDRCTSPQAADPARGPV
eukprot:3890209-Pyramimonas_sp.AAC.1